MTVLRAAALLAPEDDVEFYEGLGALPHFNPDLDGEGAVAPHEVAEFRERVARADALLICSPEYAHGVPGSLKNALDWLVSSPVIIDKPIALINASARSTFAHAQLLETLRTMSTRIVAAPVIPLDGRKGIDAEGIAHDAELANVLRDALAALRRSIIPAT